MPVDAGDEAPQADQRKRASGVAELTAAGRPAILIPLPSATDDHQTANAREMAKAGGARMISQKNFTPMELAKQMQKVCGAGGTVKEGRIEIQGDQRDVVARILTEAGFRPIFAGG